MSFARIGAEELLRLVGAIALSCALAFPLGWERKRHSHADVGLRVFPLVAVGACVYVFVGQQVFTGDQRGEQANTLQGLMTGIGFVGAGAIIKHSGSVSGLATAAAIWTTGAIGASVAYGFYALAIMLALVNLFILAVSRRLKRRAEAALVQDEAR
ncbi:MAG TPA: MgtC/SapB family protein [Kofleriaceae bacterium]|jgi:putative Mg2+ transporter-C (MgtC) family protein|nr:MgtC/SapB family protein [Kofleriaceae bacterium]